MVAWLETAAKDIRHAIVGGNEELLEEAQIRAEFCGYVLKNVQNTAWREQDVYDQIDEMYHNFYHNNL